MGLEYRAQLEQKALRDLHRSFYIFATVIVFFAVLGFVFIVWYYGALSPKVAVNTSTNDLSISNTSASRTSFFGTRKARVTHYPTASASVGVLVNQDRGVSVLIGDKSVWLFGSSSINVSASQDRFTTVLMLNAIMLLDTSTDYVHVYTDLLSNDTRVISVFGIGSTAYIFYTKNSNIFGVGKLDFVNGTVVFSVEEVTKLYGTILMATITNTHVLIYCQGLQIQVFWIPKPAFEMVVNNKQFWVYFKPHHTPQPANSIVLGLRQHDTFYSVEWNEYWSQFVLLSTLDGHLYVWHASLPHGPFTPQPLLTRTVFGNITHAYFHKGMWRGEGKTMVLVYCTSVAIGGSLAHLVEVEL